MIPGPSELLIIFGVALLLFGPSKLPQLGDAIGKSIRNFKKGMKPEDEVETNKETHVSQTLIASTTPTTPNANKQETVHTVTVSTESK